MMFQDQEFKDDLDETERETGRFEARPEPQHALRSPAAPTLVPEAHKPKVRKSRLKLLAGLAVALLALAAGGAYGRYWWTTGRYLITTDDAYVGAKNSTLSPKVSGYISDVAVEDNAHVASGDVIARIDDGDYQLAVQN